MTKYIFQWCAPPQALVVVVVGAAIICLALAGCAAPAQARPPHGKRVVGYFPEWGGAYGYHVADIPAERLTHVIYAFAGVRDGACALNDVAAAVEKVYSNDDQGGGLEAPGFHGHFRQLQLLKHKHPHLRTLLSVGGWGGSERFSDAALTDASRAKFAASAAALASRYGFDGIDIDWEFPGAGVEEGKGRREDTRNFTLLLAELRRQLDVRGRADGRRYLLTIAAPAGAHNFRNIELAEVHPLLDWVNLMTYDFAGTWSKVTSFNAPLYEPDPRAAPPGSGAQRLSADRSVRAYLDAGVPADKILLGVPFYGRAFGGVGSVNDGLFQPHDGTPPPPPAGARNWSWRVIAQHYLAKPTVRRHWHEQAKVPWLYDAAARVMVTYDDPESLRAKARYVREQDLGGVMIWELSQDDAESTLLEALTDALRE